MTDKAPTTIYSRVFNGNSKRYFRGSRRIENTLLCYSHLSKTSRHGASTSAPWSFSIRTAAHMTTSGMARLERTVITIGTIDTLLVHPREVFRGAIIAGAAAIVLMHNHPSGELSPSEADIKGNTGFDSGGATAQNRRSRPRDRGKSKLLFFAGAGIFSVAPGYAEQPGRFLKIIEGSPLFLFLNSA